jgi:hypothetical protein
MALITIRAVPNVVLHARMLWICLSFRMANRANENRIIRRIRVAVRTLRIVVRNPEPGVIERGPEPARCCMTCCARRWEAD